LITSQPYQTQTGHGLTNHDPFIDPDAGIVNNLKEKQDMEAFALLMKKYNKPVLNFCFRYCGNRQDAEDITQDVFIKVYHNIKSFKGKSKFTTWLFRLTINTCHNFKRHYLAERKDKMTGIATESDKEATSAWQIPHMEQDPEEALLNKELAGIIDKAISLLNKKQRTVIILKDFQGRTYEEIAGIMKMKPGTVKSTLARGRMEVARKIKAYQS
jgi:RNA polymerase sigma-70 factor (ECF subfamily)